MRFWPSSLIRPLAALAIVGSSTTVRAQEPFTAEDMLGVTRISGTVAVSPSGTLIAYVLPDLSDDWNVGERLQRGSVHVQRIGKGEAGPPVVLMEDQRSSFPAFSPDGSRLAFYVRESTGGRLAVWDAASGESHIHGSPFDGRPFAAPQWAGDGRLVYARPSAEAPAGEPPRVQVVHSTDAVIPGDAFFANRQRAGLVALDLATGEERTLQTGQESLRRFAVSPDGANVLAALPTRETAEVARGEIHRTLLWSLADDGPHRTFAAQGQRVSWLPDGRLTWRRFGGLVTATPDQRGPSEGGTSVPFMPRLELPVVTVNWSPDGSRFASLVVDPSLADPEVEPAQRGMYSIAQPFFDLYVVDADDGSSESVTSRFDHQVLNPVWSTDGAALFFRAIDNASYDETIYRYDVAEADLSVVASGEESFGTLMPVPGGVLTAVQSSTTPPDLWRLDASTRERARVTDLNPQLAAFEFSRPELFHFDNADGDRLGALLYKPPIANSGFPVITYVYEKLTPGIHRFNARNQIFGTHGFAVLMPNVKVKVGETGTSFVKSVVPAVEAVRASGDSNGRFCLWGGSFGAYATSFVITQTDVFDCAVSRATPPELFRNWASGRDRDSDNIESGQARMGGSPFEVMERYLSQSAFFHLDQVQTPVLITHGVNDRTILFGEGEMMFYTLRRLGKVATFVIYRDGDHSLYRHSRADALDVHERMLDWFQKYLFRQP